MGGSEEGRQRTVARQSNQKKDEGRAGLGRKTEGKRDG